MEVLGRVNTAEWTAERIDVVMSEADLDGDGKEDVFILLGGGAATVASFKVGMTVTPEHPADSGGLVGHASPDDAGLLGGPRAH